MCTELLPTGGYPIAVKYIICIVCFVSFSVLFVCKCVLKYCHRVATQLQLNISYIYCLFCVVLCIVCVYMCIEQLPPGGYPIAVKYIIYLLLVLCRSVYCLCVYVY